jgi:predicted HicB family RNase H-like nuclease
MNQLTTRFTLRLTASQRMTLEARATKAGRSVGDYIRRVLKLEAK